MSRKTRKLIWLVPLVAVFAVIGALAAIGTLGLGGASADELPNSPQNLKVKASDGNSGRTNLVLTWEASASGAPDMYRIDVSTDGDKWSPEAEVSGSTLTYTDDLTSAVDAEIDKTPEAPVSVTRYYRVFADNSHGSGQVSTTESASTKDVSTPAAVDAFGARARGPEEIELTWTVPDDGGSEILGYCIQAWSVEAGHSVTADTAEAVSEDNCKDLLFSSGPGNNDSSGPDAADADDDNGFVIRATPGSSYTHKNLRAGQTWNYTAYALNKYGHSMTASNTRQVKTASANNPPSPGNLLIRQVADETVAAGSTTGVVVQLYWTVTGDGGQAITAYRVEVTDTPGGGAPDDTPLGMAIDVDRVSTAVLNYPTGVTTGKQFAVINVRPEVDETNPVSYNLRHTVAVGTGAVADIPARLHYSVRVETGTGNSAKMSAYTQGFINVTVPDATVDPVVVPVHNAKTPNAPVVVDQTDADAADDDTVSGEIKLTVTRSTMGGSSAYRVDISDDGGDTWTMVHRSTRPINEIEYQHQGLEPNKARSFRLFTKNGSNFGLASGVVTDTSGQSKAPDRVENLMAAKNGAGEVKVSWTAPLKDNGAMVDKYCVVMNQIGDNNVVIGTPAARAINAPAGIFVSGTDANCTRYGLPDLYPGKASINGSNRIIVVDADLTMITAKVGQETRWQFEVYALNGATEEVVPPEQNGLATTSEKVHDKTTAGMTPNMPRDLTAELARDTNLSGSGKRGVLLLWNQPAAVPGAPVSSYKIERSKDGGDYEVLVSSHDASRTYYVDTSEPATGEARAYRVTAINIAGAGTQMATVMIPYPPTHTTHVATPPAPAVDALTAPSITAATPGTGTITVEWTPGENAGGHLAMLFTDDFVGDPVVATKSAADTMHTFPNVANGGYVVVVVSFDTDFDFQFVFTTVSVPGGS